MYGWLRSSSGAIQKAWPAPMLEVMLPPCVLGCITCGGGAGQRHEQLRDAWGGHQLLHKHSLHKGTEGSGDDSGLEVGGICVHRGAENTHSKRTWRRWE